MTDIWNVVAAERGALADDLAHLTDEQWKTPSLCAGWTVEDLLAHLTATASLTPGAFFAGLARSGFSFDKFTAVNIARHKGATPAETLARFRAVRDSTDAPPGPTASWLGEVLVHGEDIRRPLGIAHDYPLESLRQVADFYSGSNLLIGTKKRIAGLALRSSDTDWAKGSGEAVEGPMLSLLLAMTGRAGACDDLSGPGVATLRSRS